MDEYWLLTHPRYQRQLVEHRDQGWCARCGQDTRQIARDLRALLALDPQGAEETCRGLGFPVGYLHDPLAPWWQMDHIWPVRYGGALCGLDNLQTLCHPCHVLKTQEDRRTTWVELTLTRQQALEVLRHLTPEENGH